MISYFFQIYNFNLFPIIFGLLGSMMFEVFKKTLLFKQFYAKLYPALPAMVALLDF
jgi:hypothetical protein